LFYDRSKDTYSDGNIEEELLNMLESGMTETEILEQKQDWAALYHLSPIRENLLAWYPFRKTDRILEIGAGCGAITGILCKKAGWVDAIELSERRARINSVKNRAMENLCIYIGNFEDFRPEQEYDYITLIGVLEYCGSFIQSVTPYLDMLCMVRKYLKPEGQLILAIENKYGMKYWAGAKEDHTGRYFEGIEDYGNTKGVCTFSKAELQRMLQKTGYGKLKFYYPQQDYKMPQTIYSENYMPKAGDLRNITVTYDQNRLQLFREEAVYDSLCRDDMFGYFSNSFLIFAKKENRE
ncbi:MAG: class I SAM-dependent methyltransferase, partial [Lachnospiraceae bacterium]|nr:class I SAM-dependent methyltransferase [Lachnospiraceae bacterium]